MNKAHNMTKEEKIRVHYSIDFSSSPTKVSEEEIKIILENNCECINCSKSIFVMNDFPEILRDECEVLCEDCYSEKYRKHCPICENSYDVKYGESDYSVKTEYDAKEQNEVAGIYHFGNLLLPININYLKRIDCGDNCCEVYSDDICLDCVSDLVRKDNYMKSHGHGIPCILIKEYENSSLFNRYTSENFKMAKHRLVHNRITIRGIIETSNKQLKCIEFDTL